ncbi:class I SAM-dependent methyltransferase [uncultured Microscilla sp.]|uniref:class I SAM-dependent methyltransferase n=1 Tax=uncultured Microscilla sp. TaxID=432653 RepID=UPI0026289DB5|nr:class I SAM-dependent methyltransferase [uncultured Microscilla sp.]
MLQNNKQLQQKWQPTLQGYGLPATPPHYDNTLAAQLGVTLNPDTIDQAVKTFIQAHPQGTIINLGAGLDNRFFRLDNGLITWYDIDVPDTIELRQTFFGTNERYKLISGNIFSKSLFRHLPPQASTLLIIEGLAMYYPEHKIKALLQHICRHFSSCEILLEVIHPEVMNKVAYNTPNLPLKWAIDDLKKIEQWHPKVFLANELHHFTQGIPPVGNYFINIAQPQEMVKIGHFKIG